jgi:sensor domain CHASE-containing protein
MNGALPYIGWAALALLAAAFTVVVSLLAWQTIPADTIGGAKNTVLERLVAVAAILVAGFAWHWLFSIAPFQIIVK